ncbi:MAG: ATP-binding cassette domain-containing protein [Candidatus Izemoplasmatales bacterium]
MTSKSPGIIIENLEKKYKAKYILEKLSITFKQGNIHIITGENGSGKSTLIKCMMGLVHYQGKITLPYTKIGYAPENYCLPEHLTIYEFLYSLGRLKRANKKIISHYMDIFHLKDYQDQLIRKLSHGMKQKLNLLQAMIHTPQVLFLDEPFRGIDQEAKITLCELLNSIKKDTVIVISSHINDYKLLKSKKIYSIRAGNIWPS